MKFEALKVGELARRTGLTVRTLHHYDAIGLLRPSERSESGYRLYGDADMRRLYRIIAMRGQRGPVAIPLVQHALNRGEALAPLLVEWTAG